MSRATENSKLVQDFLQRAGLNENAPLDPSTREALQEILANRQREENASKEDGSDEEKEEEALEADDQKNSPRSLKVSFDESPARVALAKDDNDLANEAAGDRDSSANNRNTIDNINPPPVRSVATMQRHVSDLSSPPYFRKQDSNASTAGSMEYKSKEDRILEMLERQSQMIIDLHHRLDQMIISGNYNHNYSAEQQRQEQQNMSRQDISRRVDELSRLVDEYERKEHQSFRAQQQYRQQHYPFHDQPPHYPMMGRRRQDDQQQQQQQPAPRNLPVAAFPSPLTRIGRIIHLFFALHRHHAPNFDMGLILKVIFMLVILLSRLQSRRLRSENAEDDWMWEYRFYFMVVFVVGVFTVQSGILKYVYTFCIKEDYPGRIWNRGETVQEILQDVQAAQDNHGGGGPQQGRPAAGPRQPPLAPGQQRPEDQQQGWRYTFLGGGIAREQQEMHPVLKFFYDIGLLFGSFFLSIFPMWRPEALAGPQQPEGADNEEAEDDGDDGDGLPPVRAPQAPVEAEDDHDDDD